MNKILFGLILAVASTSAAPTREAPIAGTTTALQCRADTSWYSRAVLGKVRKTVSDVRLEPVRVTMGLPRLPTDSVVLVTDAQTCERATRAVATFTQLDPTGVELVLIRLRDRYWAEDGKLLGGEWPLVFLLDSSATRVLAQY